MSIASRVAQRYMRKVSCGGNCGCGCGKTSPVEVFSGLGALPVEVEVHRVDASDELHPDGESYMSVQALEAMREHAEELLQKIDSGTPLPDWVEAKITRASESLLDVYEYMAHGHGKKTASQYEGTFDPMQDYPQLYKELRTSGVSWGAFFKSLEDYVINNGDAFSAVRDLRLKLSPRAMDEVEELGSAIEDLHGHGKSAAQKLLPGQFHVEYPNYKTIRLLVYAPGHSTFFEARADERAVPKLLLDLQNAGLTADPEDLQEAIEQA
jgi:hypothetical protein